jgi:hypothetical protein
LDGLGRTGGEADVGGEGLRGAGGTCSRSSREAEGCTGRGLSVGKHSSIAKRARRVASELTLILRLIYI